MKEGSMPKGTNETKLVVSDRVPGSPLTRQQLAELDALAELEDDQIDVSEIPEITDEVWKHARRMEGLYRPIKKALSVRVDADVLAWLKKDGPGYQSRINAFLRERMLADLGAQGEGRAVPVGVAAPAGGTAQENSPAK